MLGSPKRPVRPTAAALRPTPNIHVRAAISSTTPIATRDQVGRSDGVTKASVNPAKTNITIVPSRTVTARSPSSASAVPRVRSPGANMAHAILRPAPDATAIAVSSMRPWGVIRPQKSAPLS